MDPHPYGTLNGRSTEEIFILIYVLVDRYLSDLIKQRGPLRRNNNGARPKLSDAEVITIILVGQLKQMPSERAWYHEVQTTWRYLFPTLNERSRFVRRRLALGGLINRFRAKLIEWLGLDMEPDRLIDSTSVKLAHYKRAKYNLNKRFRPKFLRSKSEGLKVEVAPGMADIGYNAVKEENYFGMKLHVLITRAKVPVAWYLTAATVDDRRVVEHLIDADPKAIRGQPIIIWADSGYVSKELALQVSMRGHRLHAMPKTKRKEKWPEDLLKRVYRIRQTVEQGYSDLKRFVGLDNRFRPASLRGLMSDIAAKLTAMTLVQLAPVLDDMVRLLS